MVATLVLAAVTAVLDPSPAVSGNCSPTRVHFSGRIQSDSPGRVTYTWVRFNYPAGRTFTLDFDKPGVLPVTFDLLLRKPEAGIVQLRIVLPQSGESEKVHYRVTCQ